MNHRVLLALVLLGSGGVVSAAAVEVPPPARLLETLHPGHPRLLADAEDWAALNARIQGDPRLQSWVEAVREDGEKLLDAAPSTYEIPDGKRLLATSRRVLERVRILGCLWQLDADRRWPDRAWAELEAAANFKDWNPSHFLDTAEMTQAFALGYDWMYDAWTEDQRAVLRRAIVEKGLRPGLKVYDSGGGWSVTRNNWNQVCNGGLGLGALALADVEPDLCRRVLHAGLISIQIAMNEFVPDGACIEGPGYWDYATAYNVVYLAALESALGRDFGLASLPGFSDTGWFPIHMTGPIGQTFNYADSGAGRVQAPQLFWLASRFQQPAFAAFRASGLRPTPLDLLWYRPFDQTAPAAVPLGRYFRGSEVVTFRGRWSDPETTFVGFKAGRNNASHGHLDVGTFVLDAAGERWAMDFGRDDYNLPGYFGGKRWQYYRLRAEGHNTLVVNPGEGPDQVLTATPVLRHRFDSERAFAIGDLTAAYAPAVRRLHRGMALIEGRDVILQDELTADAPVDFLWFMHTQAGVVLESAGRVARLSRGGKQMVVRLLEPARAAFELTAAAPLPASPNPDRQASNAGYLKLGIHLPGETDLRLVVLFSPEAGSSGVARSVDIRSLEQW